METYGQDWIGLCFNCPKCKATDQHNIAKFFNTWQENKRNLKSSKIKTDCMFCGCSIEIIITIK